MQWLFLSLYLEITTTLFNQQSGELILYVIRNWKKLLY
jgi:hypothetical protein